MRAKVSAAVVTFTDDELDTLFTTVRFGLNAAVGYAQRGEIATARKIGSDNATACANLLRYSQTLASPVSFEPLRNSREAAP